MPECQNSSLSGIHEKEEMPEFFLCWHFGHFARECQLSSLSRIQAFRGLDFDSDWSGAGQGADALRRKVPCHVGGKMAST
jgi:hypothetical protein